LCASLGLFTVAGTGVVGGGGRGGAGVLGWAGRTSPSGGCTSVFLLDDSGVGAGIPPPTFGVLARFAIFRAWPRW
jgi:hypothetical protein